MKISPRLLKYSFVWGTILWFVGYVLGIVLFMVVPPALIGWVITPIGIALTLWVLFKKIQFQSWSEYLVLAVIWTTLAIILDYFLLVKVFKPVDGYYKLDVYVYYLTTFVLPLVVGWKKTKTPPKNRRVSK